MTVQHPVLTHPIERALHMFGIHSFARGVAILLATITLLMALFTYLNVRSDGNSKRFDTTAQKRYLEAVTLEINGKTQVSFDWGVAYKTWKELDVAAESALKAKDAPETERLMKLRDAVRNESELLSDTYFRDSGGEPGKAPRPDLARYETDLYLKLETRLSEEAQNLADIKSFWDGQVNRYITVLAFLSAALFIGGLALTVPRAIARPLVAMSVLMVVGGTLYGVMAYRNQEPRIPASALDAYADGVAALHLAESEPDYRQALVLYDESVSHFSKAIKIHDDYTNALFARAETYVTKGIQQYSSSEKEAAESFAGAVTDYLLAQEQGRDDASANWNLGWVYYLLGEFDKAAEVDKRALQQDPSLFAVRSNLGLVHLADGRIDEGEREIMQAANEAAQGIIAARLAYQQPPASSWLLLEAIGADLNNLWMRMNGEDWPFNEAPPQSKVRDIEPVKKKAAELRDRVSNITVSLEETGKLPPSTPTSAKISDITVSSLVTRNGPRTTVRGPKLPEETTEIELQFRYENMKPGSKVVWRVFHQGQQDRLLARHRDWTLGASGTGSFALSYSYSSLYHFKGGYYVVEMFVDNHLVGRTTFTVEFSS